MKPVRVVEGRGVPLDRSDVDTDQIIPSGWLKRVERTGFGRGLFSEWRDESNFVLNQPQYQGATILLSGARFGTGSSREHAVWALMDYGFEAVVASSFGDIFKNNAAKLGLVTVELSKTDLAELIVLIKSSPATTLTIDVEQATIECAELDWRREFILVEMTRQRLLHGWDDISITLQHEGDISLYEEQHERTTPSLHGLFDSGGSVLQLNEQTEGLHGRI